jgi:hypothetical protein
VPRPTAALAAVLALLALAAAPPAARDAGAEHDVASRYVVLGYVKDGHGQALPGVVIELVRDRTGFSYLGDTDAEGLFVLVARLGDESLGETLTLRVGARRTQLTARFDPVNHAEERGTQVDLEGARFIERAASFRATLAHFLASPAR